uniref:NAC domain-containing protein n=1 Tax=Oryza nivara TaxID=4536 RepID=A0A0E0IRS8_ORYNI
MKDGYIYFFSKRQFATKARNKRRPMRVADGGTWKASGGSKKLEDLAVYRVYKIRRKEDTEPVNAAAAVSSTDEPSTPAALPLPTPPPRPLPDMAGSSSATSLLPLQLPGLAGSSSTMPLALPLQLPGLPRSSSVMSLPGLAGEMTSMGHGETGEHGLDVTGINTVVGAPTRLELTDGTDGDGAMADGDTQLDAAAAAAEFDSERVAEIVSQIMDGEFEFKFDDDTIVSFNEVVAAPMLIDGDGDGDGDGADGGVGDDPFEN